MLAVWGLLVFCLTAKGQVPDAHLDITLGATHERLIDEAYTNNRLKFSGTNFFLASTWQKLTPHRFTEVSFQGSTGSVYTADRELDASMHHIRLAAGHGIVLSRYTLADSIHRVYIGGQISTSNYLLEDIIDDTWYTGNATATFNHTLNLLVKQSGRLGKRGILDVALDIPLMGWVKRAAYEDGVNQDMERAWQNKRAFAVLFGDSHFRVLRPWALPQLTVQYSHQAGRLAYFTVSYQYRYVHHSHPRPIGFYANGVTVGFRFYFDPQHQ